MHGGMALLCEYFVALDDASAATTIDWPGGPSSPPAGSSGFPTLPLPGIEPTVMMGTLDEILTGRSFDDVLDDPSGHEVTSTDSAWVWALPVALQDALASSGDDRLRSAAASWAQTEEFGGQADAAHAADAVLALARMVRSGRESGAQLYCWFAL